MSFLNINEIRGKTSGTPTDVNDLKYQLATAWVNFDGTGTVSIRDSYNVSSITDEGTGTVQINFATAMDNGIFTASGVARLDGSGVANTSTCTLGALRSATAFAASSFRSETFDTGGARRDCEEVTITIHGGKT